MPRTQQGHSYRTSRNNRGQGQVGRCAAGLGASLQAQGPDHVVSVSEGLQETKPGGTGQPRLKGRHTGGVRGAAAHVARPGICRGLLCRDLVQLCVGLRLWHL